MFLLLWAVPALLLSPARHVSNTQKWPTAGSEGCCTQKVPVAIPGPSSNPNLWIFVAKAHHKTENLILRSTSALPLGTSTLADLWCGERNIKMRFRRQTRMARPSSVYKARCWRKRREMEEITGHTAHSRELPCDAPHEGKHSPGTWAAVQGSWGVKVACRAWDEAC